MSECHTLFPDSKLDETMGGLLEGPIGPGPRDIISGNWETPECHGKTRTHRKDSFAAEEEEDPHPDRDGKKKSSF